MSPDELETTFIGDVLFWLRYVIKLCDGCKRPIFFTPFVECERCSEIRIAKETCPACHQPLYLYDERNNFTRCLNCGYVAS